MNAANRKKLAMAAQDSGEDSADEIIKKNSKYIIEVKQLIIEGRFGDDDSYASMGGGSSPSYGDSFVNNSD